MNNCIKGKFLEKLLLKQHSSPTQYSLSEADQQKLKTHTVNRIDKVVSVSIPEDEQPETHMAPVQANEVYTRESIQVQPLLARLGECMGIKIWIPKADRGGVLRDWKTNITYCRTV